MKRRKQEPLDPLTESLYNERGEEGRADGFFCVEDGMYKAVLIAEKRWRTRAGAARKKRATSSFAGGTARELAKNLRDAGWEPPKGLARLCESSRAPSSWGRR